MTKTRNITSRVAELSATLQCVDQPYNDSVFDEMYGKAEEFIGYNNRYNCYYGIDDYSFDSSYNTCVLQKHEEFQVLRFFQVDTYMSGEGMKLYYENMRDHEDDEDWMDDEIDPECYLDELEIKDSTFEYKQIWIDRFGNIEIVQLRPSFVDGISAYVKVESLQTWASMPNVQKAIFDNIDEETDFCHTYNEEPTLDFYLSKTAEYLHTNEPLFYDALIQYGYSNRATDYFNTFRIAHRHNWAFPTTPDEIRKYLSILDLLKIEQALTEKNYLNAPEYICPKDISKIYDRYEQKRKKLEEQHIFVHIKKEEPEFAKQHSYLFGIEFDSPNLHFKSLDSVLEYYHEGEDMHHCIYKCRFYDKHNYLSMHISDHEGNRVATCTINVLTRTINQIQPIGNDIGFRNTYGMEWKETNEYREAWITLMARMHTFPKPQLKTIDTQTKVA